MQCLVQMISRNIFCYFQEQKLKERLEHEASMTDEEKSAKKSQALDLKKQGNEFYLAGDNLEAIRVYDEALEICPLNFKEDRAILLSNKAAALIKNDEKEKAIEVHFSQCEHLMNCLSLIYCVKSILNNLEVLRLLFLQS